MGADDAAEDERAYLTTRQYELTRRRRLLQLRWDRQGDDVDPAIPVEIEDIDKTLAEIAVTLSIYELADIPTPSPEAIAQVRSKHINFQDLLITQLASLGTRLTHSEEQQVKTDAQVQDVAASLAQWVKLSEEWREMTGEHLTAIKDEVVALAHGAQVETVKREWGQRRNLWLSVAAIVLMLLIAALLLWVLS